MNKFKSYEKFNESIENIFRSAHAAIDRKNLKPLKDFIGKPKFPTQKELDDAVELLHIDPSYLFYNPGDFLNPIIYWKGPVYYGFFGGLNLEALKMMRTAEYFEQLTKYSEEMIKMKKFIPLFHRMEKKILIPAFVEMYDMIPDDQKYDIFIDLYVRSEFGFEMFPEELLKDVFSKREFSKEWKKRMEDLKKIKTDSQGLITAYRGEGAAEDVMSWTLDKKIAEFFANRFGHRGKILKQKIDPDKVVDYLTSRGESELLMLPERLQESANTQKYSNIITVSQSKFTLFPSKLVIGLMQFFLSDTKVAVVDKQSGWTCFSVDDEQEFIPAKDPEEPFKTEFSAYESIVEFFKDSIEFEKEEKKKSNTQSIKILESHPIFGGWMNKCKKKFSGKITGRKFGL